VVLATAVAVAADKKTIEREQHPWNEKSSYAEIHG
jgi:hypothetical protein